MAACPAAKLLAAGYGTQRPAEALRAGERSCGTSRWTAEASRQTAAPSFARHTRSLTYPGAGNGASCCWASLHFVRVNDGGARAAAVAYHASASAPSPIAVGRENCGFSIICAGR
uniref:Uncharacterized protein n=1 Tax=Oryza sativa subsp. japonica TaxID=39947 RepID=Q84YS3_ORYSJ|nr:hypothetical protein [Oryza sativa Japonica Group]